MEKFPEQFPSEGKRPIDEAIDWYNLAVRGEKTYAAPILRDAIAEELITTEEASRLYKHQDEPKTAERIAQLNVQIGPARQQRLESEKK